MPPGAPKVPPPRRWGPDIRTVIAVVVTVVWCGAYLVSIFNPNFKPDPSISSVMVLIVAYLFVTEREKRRNGH